MCFLYHKKLFKKVIVRNVNKCNFYLKIERIKLNVNKNNDISKLNVNKTINNYLKINIKQIKTFLLKM